MDKQHPIIGLMDTTLQKIREMVDVNTIIGQPINTPDGITVIPISKVSFGFGTGGSDIHSKHQQPSQENGFGGGSGAGINISPVAFLIIKGESVKVLPISPPANTTVDRLVEMVPEVIDKIPGLKKKRDKDSCKADNI